jgi:hypothetical protein
LGIVVCVTDGVLGCEQWAVQARCNGENFLCLTYLTFLIYNKCYVLGFGWVKLVFSQPAYIIPHSYNIVKFFGRALGKCIVTKIGVFGMLWKRQCYK